MHWPTVVDLFCGCGGVTAGLKRKHFKVVAAVDNDPVACETYRQNHPTVHLFEDDINNIDPDEIRRRLLGKKGLDLLVVCAPCQPFSNQNKKPNMDTQAELILNAIGFAEALNPKVIFFENVPGLTNRRFAPLLNELKNALYNAGYFVGEPQRIDAADYGVPQRRFRCIMLMKRGGLPPRLPSPTTPPGWRMIVADAIGDLSPLKSGEADANDPLHFARNHRPIALERLTHIPKNGGSRSSLPAHLRLNCHNSPRSYPDVYGRMRWDDVAPTLTTGCTDITRGRFAHPEDDRAITLREAARLQTFPNTYLFSGSSRDIATQIGNAVPVRLIEILAPTLRAAIRS